MRITIEGSEFSEVPDGVYEIEMDELEDCYVETTTLHRLGNLGDIISKEHTLAIRGPISGPKPEPDQRRRVLKEALELLWETQVAGEVQTEATDGVYGTPPGSFWIEALEAGSGIKDVNRSGWTQEDYS